MSYVHVSRIRRPSVNVHVHIHNTTTCATTRPKRVHAIQQSTERRLGHGKRFGDGHGGAMRWGKMNRSTRRHAFPYANHN
jgi:hypothetical protein